MPYNLLDAGKIVETADKLSRRINERFPNAGLVKVSRALTEVAQTTAARAEALSRPSYLLWILIIGLIGAGVIAQAYIIGSVKLKIAEPDGADVFTFFQGLEAALNTVVIIGAGLFFLITIEERIKRRRVLTELHQLRSLIHIIDMHQLTKDPSAVLRGGPRTAHSPDRTMSPFELNRYLDYCSELLSLTGKIAALYAQHVRDPVVVQAVNDIESLSTNLSRKIWQKIMIMEKFHDQPSQAAE